MKLSTEDDVKAFLELFKRIAALEIGQQLTGAGSRTDFSVGRYSVKCVARQQTFEQTQKFHAWKYYLWREFSQATSIIIRNNGKLR